MKMKQFKWVCLVVLGALHPAKAQQSLPLSAAIDTALYNNLGLIISRNQASIAANNLSYGNAGMLPRIDLNAGANLASNNLNQKFNTGSEINKKGVVTKAYNGQLALNWTLFDGTKMFATYQKLEVLKSMGELNVQIKSEELVSNVTKAYAEIVRQKILLQGTQNNISLYEERVKLAEARLQLGKSSRTELLQASVDLNLQKSNLIKQKTLLKNSMTNLNRLLMTDLNTNWIVSENLELNANLDLPQTLKDLESGNKQLQTLRMAQQQTQFEIKEQESFYYPRVNLNAGYNFTSNSSTQGLFLVNQSRGPVAGLTLNWNLYNGTQRKQVENAKLLHQNTTLQYQDAKIGLETMVINAWQNYNDALQLAKTEQESYKMAQEYVAITMERFRLNEATILELKDAQQSIEASVTRLANTLYEAKNAETELLFLIGKLVK